MKRLHIGEVIELAISHVGGLGDGIGSFNGHSIFVPYTIGGDVVRAEIIAHSKQHYRARLQKVLTSSFHRITPPCIHFTVCGGCQLQHMDAPSYQAYKQDILLQGLNTMPEEAQTVHPLTLVPLKSRRRVTLHVSICKGEVTIGFSQQKSHHICDISECHIMHPDLMNYIATARSFITSLKKPSHITSLHITHLEEGLDVTYQLRKPLHNRDHAAFENHANTPSLARLSCTLNNDITYFCNAHPRLMQADYQLAYPQGAFLQASAQAQSIITEHVLHYLKDARHIADLYAGCGTYTLALHTKNRVIAAYEGSSEMTQALISTISAYDLEAYISAHTRDLFHSPLRKEELSAFDAAVINPPRNGALTQIKELAQSNLGVIVMVSCNPATFARDGAVLQQSGYILSDVGAIDQFTWSTHLEVIGRFVKN